METEHGIRTNADGTREEWRQYRGFNYESRFGRSSFWLRCPFCNELVRAFVWSIAGSGKRCPGCEAMFVKNIALKRLQNEEGSK